MKSLISFAFYRKNIEFGTIELSIFQDDRFIKDVGAFYVPRLFEKEMEEPKVNDLRDYGYIPWAIFYNKIDRIIKAIEENNLYIFNLQENKILKNYISIATIPIDASTFEFEFHRLFPNYPSIKCNDENYEAFKNELINIKNNNKNLTRICDNYIVNLFNPSLKERLDFALNEFDYLLKEIFTKIYQEYDKNKISKNFRDARNNVDHGSLSTKIDSEIANAYYCVRMLTLAMTLKRFEFSDEEIKKSVRSIFEIRL